MVEDLISTRLQGNVLACHKNVIQGMNKDDFQISKEWHKAELEKYDLWDYVEADLMILWIKKHGVIDVVGEHW